MAGIVRMLPSEAHRVKSDGSIEEVSVSELVHGDRVLVKPGEKVPQRHGGGEDEPPLAKPNPQLFQCSLYCTRYGRAAGTETRRRISYTDPFDDV